ncbi:hypothetical protein, partial [Nonomuraea antimicrobica]|uniref:hypothetical protein n=1 Tax=Nonomuraea antimicrobica TaxID=561173 RepID=UPI0031EB3B81
ALAVTVTVAVLLLRPTPEPQPEPKPPAPAPVPLPTPRQGVMASASTSELKIADTGITLHENPADPVWTSSYHIRRGGYETYARDPATGAFGFFGNWEEPVVSPGGRFVVSLPVTRLRRTDHETVRLRDRATGQDRELRTVDKPRTLFAPFWSSDGRRVLATVFDSVSEAHPVGFAVVDAVAGTVKVTEAPGAKDTSYVWGSDDASVLQQGPGGDVRALALDGRVLRSFPGVGPLAGGGAARTPLGTVFATKCPQNSRRICFWEETTGARKGEARLPDGAAFHGWLDARHLLVTVPRGERSDIAMADATGKVVRTLADGPKSVIDDVTLWFTRK